MSPDLDLSTLSAFPHKPFRHTCSGIMDSAPSLQWRDRAGFSPASILASLLRCSGQTEEHKTFIQLSELFYHVCLINSSIFDIYVTVYFARKMNKAARRDRLLLLFLVMSAVFSLPFQIKELVLGNIVFTP